MGRRKSQSLDQGMLGTPLDSSRYLTNPEVIKEYATTMGQNGGVPQSQHTSSETTLFQKLIRTAVRFSLLPLAILIGLACFYLFIR